MPSRSARASANGGPPNGRASGRRGRSARRPWPTISCKWNLRDLEAVFNGAIRALAQGGVFGAKVTGIADGTDLETTDRYRGCGQVTRKVRIEDKRGRVHEIEVTVYGWKVLLLIDAATKIPLAVKVGKIQEHETHWTRALVTQARANLAGHARLQKVVFDKGFLDGTDLWWLDQQGLTFVVPAKTTYGRDRRCPGTSRGWGGGSRWAAGCTRCAMGRAGRPGRERLETEVVGYHRADHR